MSVCTVCGSKAGFMMSMCDSCIAQQNIRSAAAAKDAEATRNREEADLNQRLASVTLTTTPALDGFRVTRTIDVISAEYVFKPTFFRDVAASLLEMPIGGSSVETQRALGEARRLCLRELRRTASTLGANAVLAVSLNYSEFSGHGNAMIMLVAAGTAVIVEPFAQSA